MPRRWKLLIAFAWLICPGRAASADPVTPQIIPQCEKFRTVDGQVVCGWVVVQADGTVTLDRWKLVLRSDAELVKLRADAELVEQMRDTLGTQIVDLRGALEHAKTAIDACEERRDQLRALWSEENEKRHKAELRPRISGSVGWYVAAGLALLGGGYVLNDRL